MLSYFSHNEILLHCKSSKHVHIMYPSLCICHCVSLTFLWSHGRGDLFHQSHLVLTIISGKLYGWTLFSKYPCFVSGYARWKTASNIYCLIFCGHILCSIPWMRSKMEILLTYLHEMKQNYGVLVSCYLKQRICLFPIKFQQKSRRYPKSMIRIKLVSFLTNHMHRTKLVISLRYGMQLAAACGSFRTCPMFEWLNI